MRHSESSPRGAMSAVDEQAGEGSFETPYLSPTKPEQHSCTTKPAATDWSELAWLRGGSSRSVGVRWSSGGRQQAWTNAEEFRNSFKAAGSVEHDARVDRVLHPLGEIGEQCSRPLQSDQVNELEFGGAAAR
jgi:hypothetical protein